MKYLHKFKQYFRFVLAHTVCSLFKCVWKLRSKHIVKDKKISINLNISMMPKCWSCIVNATFAQVQKIISFCLAYKVCLLFKCIWGPRNILKDNKFSAINMNSMMLKCWSSFYTSQCNICSSSKITTFCLAHKVYLLFKCIWNLRNIFKDKKFLYDAKMLKLQSMQHFHKFKQYLRFV